MLDKITISAPPIIVLIPAYEPDVELPTLAKDIRGAGLQLVIVDDGSGEKYSGIFEEASEYGEVLSHTQNRGKGRALKTGLFHIREVFSQDCIVVTMDCDGQHRIADAIKLCDAVRKHPESLILGSRRLNENVPLRSRFGNTMTRCVYRLSTGLQVYDTQTGLRAFDGRLIPFLLGIPGERYEYEMNMLLECARHNVQMMELEIETIYIDNNAGSHFNTLKDSYRVYKEILRFSSSSLIGFLVDYGLFSLLTVITAGFSADIGLRISNIGARIVSAGVNFTLNRKFVFQSRKSLVKSAVQYFLLAVCILVGNTAVLGVLVNTFGLNRYLAKLITEVLFFVLSWAVQHTIIFHGKEGRQ